MATSSQDATQAWTEFARELATMGDTVIRMLNDHVPTESALCADCTTPGTGTPRLPWPCPMWKLARAAQGIRTSWTPAGARSTPSRRV